MHFSKSLQGSKSTITYALYKPCFNRIDFDVIPSYIELLRMTYPYVLNDRTGDEFNWNTNDIMILTFYSLHR